MQNYYNLLNREEERETLSLCLSEGIEAIPWSPLARGRLTRPWSDEPPTARAESDTYVRSLLTRTAAIDKPVVQRVNDVAHKRGLRSSQIALACMLSNPVITAPIVGATKWNISTARSRLFQSRSRRTKSASSKSSISRIPFRK